MFEQLKVKMAAKRVAKNKKRTAKKSSGFWARAWWIICAPWRGVRRVWAWLCRVDLVGMLNLALMVAIIVLFSTLIIDVLKWRNASVIVVADNVPSVAVPVTPDPNAVATQQMAAKPTLPIKRDAAGRMTAAPVNVARRDTCPVAGRQTARANGKMYGDIIVDNYANRIALHENAEIKGNLYLQNMNKYTLPCGTRVDGHLFLRNVGMLQFCGEFTVTGNIYISPRSSFGPLPRTARIGGYVIL